MSSLTATQPGVPFLCSIPGNLQQGQMIHITGEMLSDDRFFIDLRSGFDFTIDAHDDTEDDILFHMSVWPCDDEVVRNHFDENGWGEEEKSGVCPIKYNQSFNMIILVDTDHFKVALNGVHFCEFRYRKPISLAKFLYINGAVKIQAIEFRGGNQPAVGFR